ncbi:hypothetical protein [Streptomyces alkaliphilus]|uniref:hypothetical protein n=1 Tax=Streptomyces alkaliphilus TaxID=1472722 RepID=UPI00118061F4|nr:hypothetical protein [Streptomyces alkaliphilus]MQS08541.1 hypothetical protein [Streptomyces alkaliphilus]
MEGSETPAGGWSPGAAADSADGVIAEEWGLSPLEGELAERLFDAADGAPECPPADSVRVRVESARSGAPSSPTAFDEVCEETGEVWGPKVRLGTEPVAEPGGMEPAGCEERGAPPSGSALPSTCGREAAGG